MFASRRAIQIRFSNALLNVTGSLRVASPLEADLYRTSPEAGTETLQVGSRTSSERRLPGHGADVDNKKSGDTVLERQTFVLRRNISRVLDRQTKFIKGREWIRYNEG